MCFSLSVNNQYRFDIFACRLHIAAARLNCVAACVRFALLHKPFRVSAFGLDVIDCIISKHICFQNNFFFFISLQINKNKQLVCKQRRKHLISVVQSFHHNSKHTRTVSLSSVGGFSTVLACVAVSYCTSVEHSTKLAWVAAPLPCHSAVSLGILLRCCCHLCQ